MSDVKDNTQAELVPKIPEFTQADYMSSRPYEWLYQHKDNKFILQILLQQIKAQASKVGVKAFVSVWNSYLESKKQQEGIQEERATSFDDQPLELYSGEYLCNDDGVTIQDRFGFDYVVCRHPILPVKRLTNIDDGEERMEIMYRKGRGKPWRSIVVQKSIIASSTQILQLAAYGVSVTSENAKALSSYLFAMEELNYDQLPEQYSTSRLGWVLSKSFSPYVDGLAFDGEMYYKGIFNAVKPTGSRDKWVDAMRKVRAEKSIGRIFLAASFASVILEPCGLLPFFVHAWGGAGFGKTVSLMIAASVWASPRMGEYITTFNSTDVGQEMVASFLNNLPLCMDEMQIQAASGVTDYDKIIYKLCQGTGRLRGAKQGGIREITRWRNCILTTGETPIVRANSAKGATIRVIEFECTSKVYSDLIGLVALINENYGHAGKEFVEYIQQEGMFEKVAEIQKEYYHQLLDNKEMDDKQAGSASAILAADAIATELIFKDGNALTVQDLEACMVKESEANANARALEYVYELVSRNPLRFHPDGNGEWRGEVWGKTDDEYIYIVKSVFDREMQTAGYSSTAFLAWAKREGLLSCDKDGRRTRKIRMDKYGSSVNAVCLIKDIDAFNNGHDTVDDDELDLPF